MEVAAGADRACTLVHVATHLLRIRAAVGSVASANAAVVPQESDLRDAGRVERVGRALGEVLQDVDAVAQVRLVVLRLRPRIGPRLGIHTRGMTCISPIAPTFERAFRLNWSFSVSITPSTSAGGMRRW